MIGEPHRSGTWRRALAALAVALAWAPAASAQGGDASLYCTPGGGPLGALTDAEHSVVRGDPPLPAGVRESPVTVNGVSTRVLQAGPPNAEEAVVFVHGSPTSARDWDDLLAATGRFARVVAFDMPGYGKSQKDAAGMQTSDGAASYLQGVIERLGLKRIVLAGHDYGGIWGLRWAARHPRTLIGAVLIDGGVLIDYVPHPLALVFATPGAGEVQMATTTRANFQATLQALNPKPFPPGFLDRVYDDYDRATRCAILRYYRSTAVDFQTAPRQQAAALRPYDRPALVVWGEKDPYVPPEQAEKQRQAFPSARIVLFEDSGHFPHIDTAARTRGVVVPFLRPRLRASRPRVRSGRRTVVVPVRARGLLPAYRVRARILGGRGASRATTVAGRRSLAIRRDRALPPGRYVVEVTALGLPSQRLSLRVSGRSRPVALTG